MEFPEAFGLDEFALPAGRVVSVLCLFNQVVEIVRGLLKKSRSQKDLTVCVLVLAADVKPRVVR